MSSHTTLAKVPDCGLKVSEFKIQSYCYIHFWTNTFEKALNIFIPLSYGLNSTTIVLLQGWLWH